MAFATETEDEPEIGSGGGTGGRVTIAKARELSYTLSSAPSAKEATRKSSDAIIASSTAELTGVDYLGRFLSYKTMTVEDMQAFEWSFIISQFATPLQDNMIDVLNHNVFLQMASQGLRITNNPEATSEGAYMNDAYFNDKVVVESTDFAKISQTIQDNTRYMRLVQDRGSSAEKTATDALGNVTLRNICEAPVGTVYYIVDEYFYADGRDKENLFIDRLSILREGLTDDKVHSQQVKIPILVITNNVKMYLQTNIGSYMKINSNAVGGEVVAMTYNDLVGTAGSTGAMGGCNLFVDTWGNILVGHDAKYKMLLPNALNPIFTNSDSVTEIETAGYMNGSSLGTKTQLLTDREAGVQVETKGTKRSAGGFSGGSSQEAYTYRYNDRNFAFNKNFVTMYSRQLRMSGSDSWSENRGSIVFLDTYRNGHYQNFLDVKKSTPNSHRNAIIVFDGMRVAYPNQMGDNFAAMVGKNGSFVSPMMYFSKDGLPEEYYGTMLTQPLDSGDPMQGILAPIKIDNGKTLLDMLLGATPFGAFRAFQDVSSLVSQMFSDTSKNVVIMSDASDSELNGLYYLVHPDSMSISDWVGATFDDSDLPVRRYFRLCFDRGAYGYVNYPSVADTSFSYVGGDTRAQGNTWQQIVSQFDGKAKGGQLAQLFQTYNYMLGVGLNFDPSMTIPAGAMSVKAADATMFYAESNDTGLCFIGKDTFDYAQDWSVFSSGENGMFLREYRPIHTGDEGMYYEEMTDVNKGHIYSPKTFRDDIYVYNLRDTRVSDRWVNYGVEDVAMVSFVWLNYYIPKLLTSRTLIYQTSDSQAVAAAARYASGGNKYANSQVFKQFREVLNRSYQMQASDTDTQVFGGYTKTTFKKEIKNPDDVIMGPYPELISVQNYTLYPDAIPMTLNDNHKAITYNPLELVVALYKNTAWQYNTSDIPAVKVSSRDVDSTEILATIWDFMSKPVAALVNILAGTMQMAYNGLAGSNIANIFGVAWLKDSTFYENLSRMYFLLVGVAIVIVTILMVVRFVITRKMKLGTMLIRVVKTVALAMVPLLIFNATIGAIGAISNNLLQEPNAKIAAVETELTIRDRFNNDAGYEQQYQAFKQQFDTIVDTSAGFGILIPDYYVEGTNEVIYKHVTLKAINENLRYANNSIWYDHRGFVPVHQKYYKESLFYYFYDYIKYQYLYYLAETDQSDLAGQQEFAKRFEFGADSESTSADWLGQGSRGAYINFCDTQLMRSQGAYFTMMRDPNYVYGESIANKASQRWRNAYVQDLFGLGYLFQDTGNEQEPINDLKQSVTWRVFKEHSALAKTTFPDYITNEQKYEFANNEAYMLYATQDNSGSGYEPRNKPYASMTSLYRDYRYIDGMGDIKLTELESKLMQLNETIYNRVKELVYYDTAEMHDEAFIVQAALVATFETNKMFGGMGMLKEPIGPVGFAENSVSLDKILRVMFSKGMDDVANERNVIYMITGNGSGILTALIVLVAVALLFLAMLTRTILLIVMGGLLMVLCVFFYVFRQEHKRKLGMGVALQCGGILAMHVITVLAIRGIISVAVVNNSGLMQFLYAVVFLFACIASAVLHLFLAKAMFRNITSLGGDFFGYCATLATAAISGKLKGTISGDSKVENRGDITNAEETEETEDVEAQRRESKIEENNRRAREAEQRAKAVAKVAGTVIPGGATVASKVMDRKVQATADEDLDDLAPPPTPQEGRPSGDLTEQRKVSQETGPAVKMPEQRTEQKSTEPVKPTTPIPQGTQTVVPEVKPPVQGNTPVVGVKGPTEIKPKDYSGSQNGNGAD